jgi:hypothetical protein
MFVGVKNGAIAFTLTLHFWAARCEERRSPTTPCLEATYPVTPVPPTYPDVEATKTIEPPGVLPSGLFI